jgi:hypothetical protein
VRYNAGWLEHRAQMREDRAAFYAERRAKKTERKRASDAPISGGVGAP